MKIKRRLKQVFCKHEYKLWANAYDQVAEDLKASTIYYCPKCGKRKYIKEYVKAPLDFNMLFMYINLKNRGQDLLADHFFYKEIVQDQELFEQIFGKEKEFYI